MGLKNKGLDGHLYMNSSPLDAGLSAAGHLFQVKKNRVFNFKRYYQTINGEY